MTDIINIDMICVRHLHQQILYVAYQYDKYASHWSYSCSCPLFEVCAQWVDNSIFKPHFSLVYASRFQVLKPTTKFHSSDWSVVNLLSIFSCMCLWFSIESLNENSNQNPVVRNVNCNVEIPSSWRNCVVNSVADCCWRLHVELYSWTVSN